MSNKLLGQLTFDNGTLPEDAAADRTSSKDKSTNETFAEASAVQRKSFGTLCVQVHIIDSDPIESCRDRNITKSSFEDSKEKSRKKLRRREGHVYEERMNVYLNTDTVSSQFLGPIGVTRGRMHTYVRIPDYPRRGGFSHLRETFYFLTHVRYLRFHHADFVIESPSDKLSVCASTNKKMNQRQRSFLDNSFDNLLEIFVLFRKTSRRKNYIIKSKVLSREKRLKIEALKCHVTYIEIRNSLIMMRIMTKCDREQV